MLIGTSLVAFYYGFSCPENLFFRWFYIVASLIFGLTALLITTTRKISNPLINIVAWIPGSLLFILPFVHLAYMDPEFAWQEWFYGFLLYGIGCIFYALGLPERLVEGRFDIVGSSH